MLSLAHLALLVLQAPSQIPGQAPSRPGLLEALPADSVYALVVEDFASLWERARRSTWAVMATDPSLEVPWERLDAQFGHEFGVGEVPLERALVALQGAAFFGGSLEQDDLESKGLVLRLRPGFPDVETALRAELARNGEHLELEGGSFFAGRGGYSRSWEVSFEWSEGFAVIDARERENALRLAADLRQALGSGARDGGLAARLSVPRPSSSATFEAYLDVGSLIASSLEPRGGTERRTYEALDLEGFGWGAVQLALGEGSDLDVEVSLELPRAGPWPALAGHVQPAPTGLARLAPADAIEVAVLGYDVQGAWRSLRAWLAEEIPGASEELARSLASSSSMGGIDVERELIGQLSGEFTRFLLPLDTDERTSLNGLVASVMLGLLGSSGSAAGNVYVIALEDVAVVEGLVDKLIERSGEGQRVGEELVAGRRMRLFEVPELNLRPSWAFIDGALVASTYRSGVRSVLEQASEDPPPGWLDAGRRESLMAGGVAFGSSLADLEGLVRAAWVAPLAHLSEMLGPTPVRVDGGDVDGSLPVTLRTIAANLPALVEEHVSGSARTTVAIDGRVLRYRFWTH